MATQIRPHPKVVQNTALTPSIRPETIYTLNITHEDVPDIIFYILINGPTDGSYKVIIVLSTILSATIGASDQDRFCQPGVEA